MARPAPSRRTEFRAFRTLQTRWRDNDAYGHLNNAAYFSLFDTAISLWQMDQGLVITGPDAARFLVVENGCRYHAELSFPDVIDAGLRLGHLGNSSFRYEIGLFRQGDDSASAEGFFTQVNVGKTDLPEPLPETTRRILESIA